MWNVAKDVDLPGEPLKMSEYGELVVSSSSSFSSHRPSLDLHAYQYLWNLSGL
jgi:hypothetical protein